MLRNRFSTVIAVAILAGCGDGTAPPLPDPPPSPYVVSSRGMRVFGVSRVLVIPATFADGEAPTLSPDALQQQLFGNRLEGTVARAYSLASEGRFALRADIAPWIPTNVTRQPQNVEALVIAAIQGADAVTDFGRYDSDGPDGVPDSGDDDGIVDGGIAVVIPERNLTCGVTGGVHPFARSNWRVGDPPAPFATQDVSANGSAIGIRGYTVMSAADCARTSAPGATMAHELGHLLFGAPDIYHEVEVINPLERWRGRRWIMGCWELMAAGSGWGCGAGAPGASPANATFGAWVRGFIGWLQPIAVPLTSETQHTLRAVGRGGDVLAVPLGQHERILIEYRQQVHGDALIPSDGVMMYHVVDTLTFNPQPLAPRKYRASVIEADADGALLRITSEGGDRGVAGDAFGNGINEFGPGTHPGATKVDGSPLPFRVSNIALDRARGVATVRIIPVTP